MMKKILVLIVIISAYTLYQGQGVFDYNQLAKFRTGDSAIQSAFNNKQSNLQIQGSGKVIKQLSDDLKGSRHQRLILRLDTGQTLLIAHNIDLAPRINTIETGDTLEFYGEYEWNKKGGVIHWTHHDPSGKHVGGWLKHNGQLYQ